jgi:hypothetical protein
VTLNDNALASMNSNVSAKSMTIFRHGNVRIARILEIFGDGGMKCLLDVSLERVADVKLYCLLRLGHFVGSEN